MAQARDQDQPAEPLEAGFRDAGGQAEAFLVDVSKPTELDRLADHVLVKFGAPCLLVNNAGIETIGNRWEIPTERREATLNINIHGIVHGCRAILLRMTENGQEAWIAHLASMGAFGIMPQQTAYVMSNTLCSRLANACTASLNSSVPQSMSTQ